MWADGIKSHSIISIGFQYDHRSRQAFFIQNSAQYLHTDNMGNDCINAEKINSPHSQHERPPGYTPEEIEHDRKFLATHTREPRKSSGTYDQTGFRKADYPKATEQSVIISRNSKPVRQEVDLNPTDFDGHYKKARHLSKKLKLAEAEKEFIICLDLNPNSAKCHQKLGEVLGLMGRVEESMIHFQRAKQLQYQSQNEFMRESSQISESEIKVSYNSRKYMKQQAPVPTRPMEEPKLCIVCASNEISHSNKNCGHLCVCGICAAMLYGKCPLCNQMGSFIKIYTP